MQQNPRDIILQVLIIIGYEDDKEVWANKFLANCEQQALINVLNRFSQGKKDELIQKMAGVTDQQKRKAIISQYIIPQEYTQALIRTSGTAFEEFIDEIMPILSEEQTIKLQTYLQ